jgi:FtsH-binding integral membrane protein
MRIVAPVTLIVGIMLTVLGLRGCFSPEPSSLSAGTPFWIGLALVLFGVVALKPNLRKHAMHVAALVGLAGFIIGGLGIMKWIGGGVSSFAGLTHSLMMLVCGIFLALCVNSFMRARRKRAKERAAAA